MVLVYFGNGYAVRSYCILRDHSKIWDCFGPSKPFKNTARSYKCNVCQAPLHQLQQNNTSWHVKDPSKTFCMDRTTLKITKYISSAQSTILLSLEVITTDVAFVVIGKPERQVRKASHCGSKQQQRSCAAITLRTLVILFNCSQASIGRDYTPQSLYYCLFVPRIYILLFFTHILFVVNHTFSPTPPERLQHITC